MTGWSTGAWVGASPRRAPEEELERMLGLFRDKYADFTVKHFHEQLQKRHGYVLGYTVTKLALARGGPGAEGAEAVGAPQEASTAAAAGHAAAPGRVAPRLARRSAGDGPDRDDGRCDERDLLDVPGRGGRDGVDVPGLARGDWRAWPVLLRSTPIAAAITSTRRRPARRSRRRNKRRWDGPYRISGIEHIAAYSPEARGRSRADVRHAAGPAAEGPAARRDQDGRGRQRVAEGALHRRAQRGVCDQGRAGRARRSLPTGMRPGAKRCA